MFMIAYRFYIIMLFILKNYYIMEKLIVTIQGSCKALPASPFVCTVSDIASVVTKALDEHCVVIVGKLNSYEESASDFKAD